MTTNTARKSAAKRPDPRPPWWSIIEDLRLLERLRDFDPAVVGTPPLGLDLPTSDIDVVCQAVDGHGFTQIVWRLFGALPGFTIHQWIDQDRPIVINFDHGGWPVEIFASPIPVRDQAGFRHFAVEQRLLRLGGDLFRAAVRTRRSEGLKTEPAFAEVLGLHGDPYVRLLDLEALPDAALRALLHRQDLSRPSI